MRLLSSDSFGTCISWCNQSNFPPDQPESRFFGVLVASVCVEPSERMEVEQKCVAREVEANVGGKVIRTGTNSARPTKKMVAVGRKVASRKVSNIVDTGGSGIPLTSYLY